MTYIVEGVTGEYARLTDLHMAHAKAREWSAWCLSVPVWVRVGDAPLAVYVNGEKYIPEQSAGAGNRPHWGE